jgi:antitoxin VapB
MSDTRTAKLFKNGASQAVRLPAEFRFEGTEVYATRDDQTGDVVLSQRPGAGTWRDFFALMETIDVSSEFMADRPLNVPPRDRDVF